MLAAEIVRKTKFLPMLSARRATNGKQQQKQTITISTHALREESDELGKRVVPEIQLFLSTLSARRATRAATMRPLVLTYFYPRSPRGERPINATQHGTLDQFLSTLSARRATVSGGVMGHQQIISIHALREESDMMQFSEV